MESEWTFSASFYLGPDFLFLRLALVQSKLVSILTRPSQFPVLRYVMGRSTPESGDGTHGPLQVFENTTDVTSYSYDSSTKELVSYDDPHIVQLKAQYIVSQGLAGSMFWEVCVKSQTWTIYLQN